ncbi:hypothetical protein CMUS01_14226 [Colletotrichum musicola]|uniref:Uncharacterized protein n=1 Tax=Colletotrichum musicola TaxID=2175873 RepID=A0A8H6MSU2_9PEZI|nr:hypothetical protein CMUS01_14226 [Colletotrichum musicola]
MARSRLGQLPLPQPWQEGRPDLVWFHVKAHARPELPWGIPDNTFCCRPIYVEEWKAYPKVSQYIDEIMRWAEYMSDPTRNHGPHNGAGERRAFDSDENLSAGTEALLRQICYYMVTLRVKAAEIRDRSRVIYVRAPRLNIQPMTTSAQLWREMFTQDHLGVKYLEISALSGDEMKWSRHASIEMREWGRENVPLDTEKAEETGDDDAMDWDE